MPKIKLNFVLDPDRLCSDEIDGVFKSGVNLAVYSKKHFASVEIDTELERINAMTRRKLYPIKFLYLPTFVTICTAVLVTLAGGAISLVTGKWDVTLLAGFLLLLSGTFLLFTSRVITMFLQRRAFHNVEKQCHKLNRDIFQARGITWRLQFSKAKQSVVTSRSPVNAGGVGPLLPYFDPFVQCFDMKDHMPTLYIDIPESRGGEYCPLNYAVNSGSSVDQVSSTRSSSSSSSLVSNEVAIEMTSPLVSKVKQIYCTHCGFRSPVSITPVENAKCGGCFRLLQVPKSMQWQQRSISSSPTLLEEDDSDNQYHSPIKCTVPFIQTA